MGEDKPWLFLVCSHQASAHQGTSPHNVLIISLVWLRPKLPTLWCHLRLYLWLFLSWSFNCSAAVFTYNQKNKDKAKTATYNVERSPKLQASLSDSFNSSSLTAFLRIRCYSKLLTISIFSPHMSAVSAISPTTRMQVGNHASVQVCALMCRCTQLWRVHTHLCRISWKVWRHSQIVPWNDIRFGTETGVDSVWKRMILLLRRNIGTEISPFLMV